MSMNRGRFPAGLLALAFCAFVLSSPALSADLSNAKPRPELPPGGTNYSPSPLANGISVTETNDPDELLECLLGPDVVVTIVSLAAASGAAGTFAGGLDIVGFDEGIVLSTGNILTLPGPNQDDGASYNNGYPGDPDLDALIPGFGTNDAAILQFDFVCETATEVSFQYVFTSDEYNEYVNTDYNDVFGFFLNGVNIAEVPSLCSDPGIPVSINNINCGNPFINDGPNCDCFRNNDLDDGGGDIDTEMDGLTQVFFASGTIQPGTNTIKIAIADAGDFALDSNVLIRCQSFNCGEAPEIGACCFPNGACVTLPYEDCFDQGGDFYGDGIPCVPNPCDQPVGACCFDDGTCQVVGQEGCLANDGTYMGEGTACDPDPCPPAGACCFEGGICLVLIDELCAAEGGAYQGDETVCDPNPCNLPDYGACCFRNASCRIVDQERCELLRGLYMGDGSVCDPSPCVAPADKDAGDKSEEKSWGRIKEEYRWR